MTENLEKGRLLELATKLYLEDEGFTVYSWKEFASKNGFTIQDTGIDLVAEKNGQLYAVQCKNWNNEVSWENLGTFVGSLILKNFDFKGGILVATKLTLEAEKKIHELKKDIIAIPVSDIEEYLVKAKAFLEGKPVEKEKKELRPYQKEAIESVIRGFQSNGRGKLIMPPGTGKTLVSLKIAENFGKGSLILFLCPSIALLDQSIKVWFRDGDIPINSYAVVSDTGVGKEKDELNAKSLLSYPATTSAQELITAFNLDKDKLNVIFSTYQSLDVVKQAQILGLPEFDLILCDEAHRTAGVSTEKDASFKLVHSNENIKGKKRLYMTATPKVFDVKGEDKRKIEEENFIKIFDMNDEDIFGPKFFEYSFRKAIQEGYLSDYRIVAMELDKKEVQKELHEYLMSKDSLDVDETTKLVGLGRLVKGDVYNESGNPLDLKIKSGIVFTSKVAKSKKIAEEYPRIFQEYFKTTPPAEVKHIDGNMSAFEKRNRIDWLKGGNDKYATHHDKAHILTNAKVLTEGIDVPALDFVAFLEPKESIVDIIQAVGRVIRKAEGKDFGLIFIPLVVDTEKENVDEQVEKTSYKTMWQVIGALTSLDSAFESQIRHILIKEGNENKKDKDKDPEREILIIDKGNIEQKKLFEPIRKYLSAKIVKSFRLGSIFLKDWAVETAKIAKDLKDQIQIALEKDQLFRQKFEELRDALSTILNEGIEEQDTIDLIVQYILTKPIFNAVFEHKDRTDEILDSIFEYFKHFLENNIKKLDEFYEEVQNKAKGLRNEEERQEFLRHLYTNFFNVAFKERTDEAGIAYTPVPLVSFITKFVNYLTQKHFGKQLHDEGVVLFEPFAGTGTFISLAIENMDPQKLKEKLQRKEIWANEILLLPYMAMTKNIESVISKRTGKFIPFETALWTDSFDLMENLYGRKTMKMSVFIPKAFQEVIEKQLQAKVNVIISNPPWRAGRENENVGRRNIEYKNLRKRIEQTYAKYANELGVTNANSLYDMYIQALRMASDRIEEGVIGFILNNGWLKGLSGRGIRKALSEEFAEVYVYDLRGDARKRSKKEGENVFPIQTGNCLLFLVKRRDKKGTAKIFYKAVKDYAKKEEKFAELREWEEKPNQIPWQEVIPNEKHDWIDKGDEEFEGFVKLGDKKSIHEIVVFNTYSRGLATGRDDYAYNFSKDDLKEYMERLIDTFNEHLEKVRRGEITKENVEENIEKDQRKIKWDRSLKKWLFRLKDKQEYKEEKVFPAFYRPFTPVWAYFDRARMFNAEIYQLPSIFLTPDTDNLVIAVSGRGSNWFDVFITDRMTDLGFLSPTQIFPLYTYAIENNKLFDKTIHKQYNITDKALEHFQQTLNDKSITKEDIFYYVFGVLSTPSYVEKFKNNLTKELPRVPILENFKEISEFGKQLAVLQLNYQRYISAIVIKDEEKPNIPEYSNLTITADENALKDYLEKVKLDKKNREITINGKVRVQNIPEIALKCKVGNYPPIEWISKYLVRQEDKDTGIIWDPKIKVEEFINVVKKLIAFSQMCLEIKEKLNGCYN